MNIRPICRKRSLTNFNGTSSKQEYFPVQFYCYDRGKYYYIGTDYRTSDKEFKGVFNEKTQTKTMNKLMTDNFIALWRSLEEFAELNKNRLTFERMKIELTQLVKGCQVGTSRKKVKTLADYVDELADKKETKGTRRCWQGTAKKIREFDSLATFDSVDVDWLERFEKWMADGGCKVNTRGIQLRNLRASINWAIREGKLTINPFSKFKIKEEFVDKWVMSAQDVADFRDYPCEEWQEKYRDITMLSFYLGGINVGDLLLMKSLDVNGRCTFYRRKTGVKVSVPVCPEAQAIIDKYKGEDYLLNMMDGLSDYNTFDQHLNKAIKKIGWSRIVKDKVGKYRKIDYHPLFPELTMYSLRYTFATIAANIEGVSIEDVGRCLGHAWALKGNVTASRYIRCTDVRVDKTFENVLNVLRGLKGRSKEELDEEIKKRDGLA